MKNLKLAGKKWDARNWTLAQKIQWQEKVFDLGYSWLGSKNPEYLEEDFFVTGFDGNLLFSHVAYNLEQSSGNLLNFEDMFPEDKEEKLDVIKEITKLFSESLVDNDIGEEDERGFEGLVVNKNVVPDESICWVIYLQDLSPEQIKFMENNFFTDQRYVPYNSSQNVVMGNLGDNFMWSNWDTNFLPSDTSRVVSFNDLFQYEDELCSVQ